MKDFGIIDCYQ